MEPIDGLLGRDPNEVSDSLHSIQIFLARAGRYYDAAVIGEAIAHLDEYAVSLECDCGEWKCDECRVRLEGEPDFCMEDR